MAKNKCIEKEIADFYLFVFALNIWLEQGKCDTKIAHNGH